jgi:hypothetical protein
MAVPYKPVTKGPLGEPLARTGTIVLAKFVGEGWVDNSSATIQLPCPYSKCRLVRAGVYATTIPIDADGTCTYQLVKREGATDTDDAVSAAIDFEGETALEMRNIPLSGTITDRTFLNIDIFEVDLVNDSVAIDTDAVGLVFVLEFVLVE